MWWSNSVQGSQDCSQSLQSSFEEYHRQQCNEGIKYPCDHCDYQATRQDNLQIAVFNDILSLNMIVSSILVIIVILNRLERINWIPISGINIYSVKKFEVFRLKNKYIRNTVPQFQWSVTWPSFSREYKRELFALPNHSLQYKV